ncbi:hypothetical protein Efla_007180 [Eimeria flavescens]
MPVRRRAADYRFSEAQAQKQKKVESFVANLHDQLLALTANKKAQLEQHISTSLSSLQKKRDAAAADLGQSLEGARATKRSLLLSFDDQEKACQDLEKEMLELKQQFAARHEALNAEKDGCCPAGGRGREAANGSSAAAASRGLLWPRCDLPARRPASQLALTNENTNDCFYRSSHFAFIGEKARLAVVATCMHACYPMRARNGTHALASCVHANACMDACNIPAEAFLPSAIVALVAASTSTLNGRRPSGACRGSAAQSSSAAAAAAAAAAGFAAAATAACSSRSKACLAFSSVPLTCNTCSRQLRPSTEETAISATSNSLMQLCMQQQRGSS